MDTAVFCDSNKLTQRTEKRISGAQALLETLLANSIDTIFGYPGGAIMPVYDALFDYQDRINHILVRHEQGAIHAAQGYARVTGRVFVWLLLVQGLQT
jgi:acetolactate synthase-1/2/3 large subunit